MIDARQFNLKGSGRRPKPVKQMAPLTRELTGAGYLSGMLPGEIELPAGATEKSEAIDALTRAREE